MLQRSSIFVLAPPGGGKGEALRLAVETKQYVGISTGEYLKNEPRAEEAIRKGDYVPDWLVFEHLHRHMVPRGSEANFFIDGIRTRSQAARLLSELWDDFDQLGRICTLRINVDPDVAVRRQIERAKKERENLQPGQKPRIDSDPKTIKHRMEVYNEKVRPLEIHLMKYTRHYEVDNNRSLELFEDQVRQVFRDEWARLLGSQTDQRIIVAESSASGAQA